MYIYFRVAIPANRLLVISANQLLFWVNQLSKVLQKHNRFPTIRILVTTVFSKGTFFRIRSFQLDLRSRRSCFWV